MQCIYKYNRDFDKFENELMMGIMALRVIMLIYCAFCLKFRHLSNNILYLECLFRMIAATVPKYINEDKANFVWGQEIGLTFVTFYCDCRGHIFALVVTLAYIMFVPPTIVYLQPVTVGFVSISVLVITMFFLATTLVAMVIIYISQLHAQLEFSNEENVKLLDGMHEGLLIFNREDDEKKQIMFCNSPARKLFQTFVGSVKASAIFWSFSFTPVSLDMVDNDSMQEPSVHHTNRSADEKTHFNLNYSDPVSLEQIVMAQQDEPDQKNCVFKLKKGSNGLEKFFQIRVKSIQFLQRHATAVYLYDITNHIKSLELGAKLYF